MSSSYLLAATGSKVKFDMHMVSLISQHLSKLGREFFWIMLGQGIAILGGIVGVRILTEMLSPASYGELALGMTVATLVQQIIMGPISGACARYFAPAQESGRLRSYLQAVKQLLTGATLLIISIAAIASLGLWALGYGYWLGLVPMALLFGLLSGYSSSLDSVQNAARQRVVVAWHQSLMQWLRSPLALATVVLLGASGTLVLLGYVLATILVLGSQLAFFKRKILLEHVSLVEVSPENNYPFMQVMLSYAWPFATWGFFTWIQLASDRWALQMCADTNSVGLYTVVYQLGYYPMTIFSGVVMQLVLPILFGIAGYGTDCSRVERACKLNWILFLGFIILTTLGVIAALFLHKPIFQMLVAPEYHNVSSSLPFMILSGGLFASGQVIPLVFMITDDTKTLIFPKIGTALLGVFLNMIGAYWMGLQGVVIANVVFSVVYIVWMLYLAKTFIGSLVFVQEDCQTN
jgi:O-antigen/teichoic acid export membrane protein